MKFGILTFSDGRDFVHRDLERFCRDTQTKIANRLVAAGHEVSVGSQVICSHESATAVARQVAADRPDLTMFNIPVWAFPHFSLLAADASPGAILLFSNLNGSYPGMVGMLAAGGGLDQIGRPHARSWGDIDDPEVLAKVEGHGRVATSAAGLRGSTFGRIGGRPMGMYTAVANSDQWMKQFGIDVEEIDQWELVRRAEEVEPSRVRAGREWLERETAGVHYDGRQLTPETLERQIRSYHAMQELIQEWKLDFSGIKAQPELTTHFATMDLTEAFLNDPYDWEGRKPVHICATEADMDGALTMQLLKSLSGTPVLFADVRHYHADRGIWDLCNSGQHATWFAARSEDPSENLRHVHLYPAGFYFPAGGASIHHLAAPGDFTFARLTRLDGRYRLQALRGRLEQFDAATNEALMRETTYEWPHAFARFEAEPDELLRRYGSNHIHAIPGDHIDELRALSRMLGMDYDGFGSAR